MRRSICRSFGSHKKSPLQASGGMSALQSGPSGLQSTAQGNSIRTENIPSSRKQNRYWCLWKYTPLHEPSPFRPAAQTPLQPLLWCFFLLLVHRVDVWNFLEEVLHVPVGQVLFIQLGDWFKLIFPRVLFSGGVFFADAGTKKHINRFLWSGGTACLTLLV